MDELPTVDRKRADIGYVAGLSLFWVIFLWGFWTRFTDALGINAFLYIGGMLVIFVLALRREGRYHKSDGAWIAPLVLIAGSFALYNNPFMKAFNLLVFPVLFAVFYNYAFVEQKAKKIWDAVFTGRIIERVFSPFLYIGQAFLALFGIFSWKNPGKGAMMRRMALGGGILAIALVIILPLLSSADAAFADKLGFFSDMARELFSSSIFGRIAMFAFLTITVVSLLLGWSRPSDVAESSEEKNVDPLVAGMVLVGILLFYLLFIWVQLDRLWVGALPFEFAQTESLVKSGFWQLLFLSFLNLAIFFAVYRKTIATVQKILSAFTIASFLLLISAGHRMLLYVTNYGFSYEKFYAFYTVLFCGILFLWLFSRLFVDKRSNVIKFVAFQFLWMYALVAVFPTEQYIVRTNLALVKRSDSQIRLFEMTMLSPDVLATIKRYQQAGLLEETKGYLSREQGGEEQEPFDWNPWIEEQEQRIADKRWYERTVSDILQ